MSVYWEFFAFLIPPPCDLKTPSRLVAMMLGGSSLDLSLVRNDGDRKSPKDGVVWPLPNGLSMAYKWGLPTTCNHGMILQVQGLPSCHLNDLRLGNQETWCQWGWNLQMGVSTSFCWKLKDINRMVVGVSGWWFMFFPFYVPKMGA